MSKSGLKNTCRSGSRTALTCILVVLFLPVLAWAADPYKLALKKWTQHAKAYTFDNLEMKLEWYATYLGSDFRRARRAKLGSIMEWLPSEKKDSLRGDQKELNRYDDFIVSIYAGSSAYPDFGQETGKWLFLLESGKKKVRPVSIERLNSGPEERLLYPYLNQWSRLYRVRFKRTVNAGESFALKMSGIPAKSELSWKINTSTRP